MNPLPFDAVVAGHVCLDVIPQFHDTGARTMDAVIAPGKLVNVGAALLATGGAVSNTGLVLLKLGARTALMGKIGDDLFGSCVRARFTEWGAEAARAMTVVAGEASSYTVVLSPPGIDRVFLHHPGANDTFCAQDINYDVVAQARLFHLGYPPLMRGLYLNGGSELIEIYRRVKALGVTTSLDLSLPDPGSESGQVDWRSVLTGVLPYVDLAPFSAEEVMYMLDRPCFDELKRRAGHGDPLAVYTTGDIERLGRALLALGARVAAVKCGIRGIFLFTADAARIAGMGRATPPDTQAWANRALWEEPFLVERVASATGSGDCAIAGFLAAFLRGCNPEQALRTACCAGGQNVQVLDAVSGIHSWEETQALTPDWPKRRQAGGTGWTYDEAERVWRGA